MKSKIFWKATAFSMKSEECIEREVYEDETGRDGSTWFEKDWIRSGF